MPNLYNRPHWTLGYLVERLRTKAPLWMVGFLATACIYGLGGMDAPTLAAGADSLSSRYRPVMALATPLASLLEATGLLSHPELSGAPLQAALLFIHALAAAAAVLFSGMLLQASGFRPGLRLQICLLLGFGTYLAGSAWDPGPEALLAALTAALCAACQAFRRDPQRRWALSAAGALFLAMLFDPRAAVLAPVLAMSLAPPGRERHLIASGSVLAGVALLVQYKALLTGPEQAFTWAQLAPGEIFRRIAAAFAGLGSSLFVAAPPALIGLVGIRRMRRFDPGLAALTLSAAGAYALARLLLVHDAHEAAVPLLGWVPILPALVPAIAFGALELRATRRGVYLLAIAGLVGGATQASRFLVDPGFMLRKIEAGGYEYPLDRSFTPEISEPVLGLVLMRAYFSGANQIRIDIPSVHQRYPVIVPAAALGPRPWPARAWRWAPVTDVPAVLPGNVYVGSRARLLRGMGLAFSLFLTIIGVLSLAILGEKLSEWRRR